MTHNRDDRARLQQVLSAPQRDQFSPGFSERALARVRAAQRESAQGTASFDAAVAHLSTRLLPLAAAAALVLAVLDIRHTSEGQSLARSLFSSNASRTMPSSLNDTYGLGTIAVSNPE
ncbi:MAG: hypothetical protein NTZ43_11635 [Gemmatimonadetes bacterium]|nr:hypothetical protein [Gemmatimonadota bacterium]